MTTREWTLVHRGETITAVLHQTGSDCSAVVAGGQKEHVGAVSICSESGEIQTILLPGHKDSFITEPWCRSIHEVTHGSVSVTAGVHYDHLTKQEIGEVMEAVRELQDRVIEYLTCRVEEGGACRIAAGDPCELE